MLFLEKHKRTKSPAIHCAATLCGFEKVLHKRTQSVSQPKDSVGEGFKTLSMTPAEAILLVKSKWL